jgi:glutamine amidotransferase
MSRQHSGTVAIVDYGMGNLFSIQQMCEHVGLRVEITSLPPVIEKASAVILPGVGAFGDAMATLRQLDLVGVLRDLAVSDKPLVGICLGMQLLMDESHEFGVHQGLGIIPGTVERLQSDKHDALKVPHVGWNSIRQPAGKHPDPWADTLLAGLPDNTFMYFVHSFYVRPANTAVQLCTTQYGSTEFCSGVRRGNITAFQFHPERSGPDGMIIYKNFLNSLKRNDS